MFNLFLQVQEEKRKAGILSENHSREIEALKADLNGQLSAMKTSYDQKILDLERRLEVALGKSFFSLNEGLFLGDLRLIPGNLIFRELNFRDFV